MTHPHLVRKNKVELKGIQIPVIEDMLVRAWQFYATHKNKIEAIKVYSKIYECDLRVAKAGVEDFARSHSLYKWKNSFLSGMQPIDLTIGLITEGFMKDEATDIVVGWVRESLENELKGKRCR